MLQLNSKWRVNVDAYTWILERKKVNKSTGGEYWVAKSYHGSLAQAIDKFCDESLRRRFGKSDVDLNAILNAIQELKQVIHKVCADIRKDSQPITVGKTKDIEGIDINTLLD